jgi:putative transposase
MSCNSKKHNRRSIRLQHYDYTQPGAYFIYICTQDHIHLFGEITKCQINPNPAGEMVNDVWHEIPTHYSGIEIDAFVIMPNHIHGNIILIEDTPVEADPRVRPKSGQPQGLPLHYHCQKQYIDLRQ